MTEIELTTSDLTVKLIGADQVFSFRRAITVPLDKVVGAAVGVDPEVHNQFLESLRVPGAFVPGLIAAGSYIHIKKRTWLFYDIHGRLKANTHAITIKLDHAEYAALVIDVDDPTATVAAINAALAARPASTTQA